MADTDAIGNQDAGASQSDVRGEISSLRSELQQLRGEIDRAKDDAVKEALGKIRLQGGGDVTISGGNGNWTVTANFPTSGVVTGTLDCDATPPTLTGTITF